MSLFLGDPSPNSMGADIERLRRILAARKAQQEGSGEPVGLGDVLDELRTMNGLLNDRLRIPQNTMSPS